MKKVVLVFVLVGVVFTLQQIIDLEREKQTDFHLCCLPVGAILRIATLEFKEAAADLLWLWVVQRLAPLKEVPLDTGYYQHLYQLLDRVTDLDPKFLHAYWSGGIAFSILADQEAGLSNKLVMKGITHNPEAWQLPYLVGFNYMYHFKDYLKAAPYMEKASKLEGRPPYLPLLTARLYNQGGNRETAVLFLKGIYLTTKDEETRKKIAERIAEIEKGEK